MTQGKLSKALKAYQQSADVFGKLAQLEQGNPEWQRDLAVVDDKIGNVLLSQGDLAAALKAYSGGLDIRQRLAKVDPGNADWQYDLGVSRERIGDVLIAQGDLAGALQSYEGKRRSSRISPKPIRTMRRGSVICPSLIPRSETPKLPKASSTTR